MVKTETITVKPSHNGHRNARETWQVIVDSRVSPKAPWDSFQPTSCDQWRHESKCFPQSLETDQFLLKRKKKAEAPNIKKFLFSKFQHKFNRAQGILRRKFK